MRSLLVVAEGGQIGVEDFPDPTPFRRGDRASPRHPLPGAASDGDPRPGAAIDFGERSWTQVEREYALHLLQRFQWDRTRAAASAAGLNRSTFISRLRKMGNHRRSPDPSH